MSLRRIQAVTFSLVDAFSVSMVMTARAQSHRSDDGEKRDIRRVQGKVVKKLVVSIRHVPVTSLLLWEPTRWLRLLPFRQTDRGS